GDGQYPAPTENQRTQGQHQQQRPGADLVPDVEVLVHVRQLVFAEEAVFFQQVFDVVRLQLHVGIAAVDQSRQPLQAVAVQPGDDHRTVGVAQEVTAGSRDRCAGRGADAEDGETVVAASQTGGDRLVVALLHAVGSQQNG